MSTAKWSSPSADATPSTTPIDGLADGSSAIVTDVSNGTDKALYVSVCLSLASMTPSTGGSVALRIRRKRGSTYEDQTASCIVAQKLLSSGASAKLVEFTAQLPGPYTYGLGIVNNSGTAFPGSGNAIYVSTFNEDVT